MTRPLLSLRLVFVALLAIALPAHAELSCTPAPEAGCRQPFVPHRSSLSFQQTGPTDPDDIYTWRWRSGSATALADYGDPLSTTDYVLCFYDASARPQPVIGNLALAATGWRALPTGYKRYYRPSRPLRQLRLHAGGDGKAAILAHGDSNTVQQLLPFTPPVVVQLQASTGTCWETSFSSPHRDHGSRFDAKD
jgi:hypothetical protein